MAGDLRRDALTPGEKSWIWQRNEAGVSQAIALTGNADAIRKHFVSIVNRRQAKQRHLWLEKNQCPSVPERQPC